MSSDIFGQVETEYMSMRDQLAAGYITRTQFDDALRALMIRDTAGRYWRLSSETGKWLVSHRNSWIPSDPWLLPLAERLGSQHAMSVKHPRRVPSARENNCAFYALFGVLVLAVVLVAAAFYLLLSDQEDRPVAQQTVPTTVPPTALPQPTASTAPTLQRTATIPPTVVPQILPTATNTATRMPTFPLPSQVTFKFDDGVDAGQQQVIRDGIGFAAQMLGSAGPITIYAYSDLDRLVQSYAAFLQIPTSDPRVAEMRKDFQNVMVGRGGSGGIWIWVSDRWKDKTLESRWRTLTHEYFHNIQSYLTKKNDIDSVPDWLLEGSAEYASIVSIGNLGMADRSLQFREEATRARSLTNPLSSLETKAGASGEDISAFYSLGTVAVDFIATRYGGYDNVATKFWTLKATRTWQDAFQGAFGVSPAAFYQAFEAFRKTNLPPFCDPMSKTSNQPLSIKFDRQQAPGGVISTDAAWTLPPNIPYTFCVVGVTPQDALLMGGIVVPSGSVGWASCGGACIAVYMKPSAPPGPYPIELQMLDGRKVRTTFQHTLVSATATPFR